MTSITKASTRPNFVLECSDTGFLDAIQIFNSAIQTKPRCVAICRSLNDIRDALAYARAAKLPVSIKSGGHNVAGLSLCQDGLVLDLSRMKSISVDGLTARVQSGVTWGELDRETQKYGLAVPGGTVTSTGVAGLTLGGGVGWLVGRNGLTCDHLIAAKVLLADGTLVDANEEDHPDLIWALRGGGGNFGVVVEFTFRLVTTPAVLATSIIVSMSNAVDALDRFGRVTAEGIPFDISTAPTLMTRKNGKRILSIDVVATCDSDRMAEAVTDEVVQRLGVGDPIVNGKSYIDAQMMLDSAFSERRRCYWRSAYVPAVHRDFAETLIDAFEKAPSSRTVILLEHLHGAYANSLTPAAFSQRHWPYNVALAAQWSDPSDDQKNKDWCCDTYDRLLSSGKGAGYLNYFGVGDLNAVAKAYSPDNLTRLRRVKGVYDPDNFFRANHNILPVSASD